MTYSEPKVTYIDPIHLLLPLPSSPDLTGPYLALLGLTGPYLVLLSLTEPYLALLSLTGPYFAFAD